MIIPTGDFDMNLFLDGRTWKKSKLHLIPFPSNLRGRDISAHIIVG